MCIFEILFHKNTLKKEITTILDKKIFFPHFLSFKIFFILLIINLFAVNMDAHPSRSKIRDTINVDSSILTFDSLFWSDSPDILIDSSRKDSIILKKKSPNAINSEVKYKGADSIRFDILKRKAYLFKNDVE